MPSLHSEREHDALLDIQLNIDRALELVTGSSPQAFEEDWQTIYAAVRCLEIISEAARRLGPAIHARHPAQPWRDIMDSGNVYRHGYHLVDAAQVRRTITAYLPALSGVVQIELNRSVIP